MLKHVREIVSPVRSQRGFALVVVILILVLVSFLVSNLTMQVRSELKVTTNVKERTAGLFLAEAGVALCVFRKLDKPLDSEGTEYEQFVEGYPYEAMLGEKGRVRYSMVDESGKIDLNAFPRPLLEIFLQYYGLDEEQVGIVVDSLLDWRDPDNLHRLNGAEKDFYDELDDPYIARNGKIEDPDEFFLVRGTESLHDKFRPAAVFTVFNPRSRINFNSLTQAMLDFITEGDPERIALYRQYQEDISIGGRLQAYHAQEILGPERFTLLRPYLVYDSTNRYYYIEATGEAGYDPALEQEAVKAAAPVDGAAPQEERHWPGLRVEALYQWQGMKVKYLYWKESYS